MDHSRDPGGFETAKKDLSLNKKSAESPQNRFAEVWLQGK
jgi:hypothetical protein